MASNPLIFKDAEQARDAILASQKQEIAALYNQWADEIGELAKHYAHQSNASAWVSERQMRELERMLRETSQQVSNEVYNKIVTNIYTVSTEVVQANNEWLKQLGFDYGGITAAFSNVPNVVLQNLITGQIYDSGWSLSARIWGDNETTLKDIYSIVAKGWAENKSTYDIAKQLEKYVRPEAAKPWNLKAPDGVRIYKSKVDYNAQRLARTLVQHGYQQSFVTTTKYNPFVLDYIWCSNGSRVCQLCQDRDGQHYKKDELPLDHPNGMCTMIPNTVSTDQLVDQLVDWVHQPDGTYPEIDQFASKLGYVPVQPSQAGFSEAQKKYLEPYGFSPNNMPKNFDDWSHKVTYDQADEILHAMGTSWGDPHPYQKLMKYYNDNLAMLGTQQAKSVVVPGAATGGITTGAEFAAKHGTSGGKTFNYWYSKLDAEAKEIAKQLKDSSGMTWQQWYEQNIYKPKGGAAKSSAPKPSQVVPPTPTGSAGPFDRDRWLSQARSQREHEMLATEAQAFAKMTDKQSAGIKTYTGSSYTKINGYLRNLAVGMSHQEAVDRSGISSRQLSAMREARDGLRAASLPRDLVLRRGTDLGDLAGFLDGDFYTNKRKLENMSVDELRQQFVNTPGTYAGFTSTSSLYDRGFSGDVEMIFYAPKGSAATSVMSISQYGTAEGETLLNAGTRVIIRDIERSDGHKMSNIRVFAEIVGCD